MTMKQLLIPVLTLCMLAVAPVVCAQDDADVDATPTKRKVSKKAAKSLAPVPELLSKATYLTRKKPNLKAKYFGFIHLCDGPAGPDGDPVLDNIKDDLMLYTAREARYYTGEGCMDIAGMIKALPENPISIELPNLKEIAARGQKEHAARCLELAKSYFKANGIEV